MSDTVTLLVEIGCEEIPARMLEAGSRQLGEAVVASLDRAGLSRGELRVMHTPRRLSALVADVQARTPEREELLVGPPAKVAWAEDGSPNKALVGFAKKQGLDPDAFDRVTTERGEYAGVRVERGGESVGEVLVGDLPERIEKIPFPKMMRWGDGSHRFVRPVHWVVALAGSDVVPLRVFGVDAGRATHGHRSLAPGEHEVPDAGSYVAVLERAGVVVDPDARRRRILEAIESGAREVGGEVVDDPHLVDESVGLVEYPGGLVGAFEPRFVERLPREVLATCLRHHQKAFSIAQGDDVLPAFAVAVNVDGDPSGHVRRGHEWVNSGRLADALFFWEEDRRRPLADRLEALGGVVFHKELGTYGAKTRRLAALASAFADAARLDGAGRDALRRAAELSRCDLVTGLVGEFPELQGVVGGLLARADGEPEEAVRAVYDLYLPPGAEGEVPGTTIGRVLGLADRLDTLAGGFAVGLAPTGSSDPFALRRAGLAAVRLAREIPALDLRAALESAMAGFRGGELGPDLRAKADEVVPQLVEFCIERFSAIAEREGARYDELAAVRSAAAEGPLHVADLARRLEALRALRGSEDFLALAAAAKRVRNILSQASERGDAVVPGQRSELLAMPTEASLLDAVGDAETHVARANDAGDYEEALRRVASLRPEVDRFFDEILVMDDNEGLRHARLGLVARIHGLAHTTVDLAEIVVEGHERR
jgi:glycyl-tRNA synthetase beta chain